MKWDFMLTVSSILTRMTKWNTPSVFVQCTAKISQVMIRIEQEQSSRRRRSISTTVVDPISVSEVMLYTLFIFLLYSSTHYGVIN